MISVILRTATRVIMPLQLLFAVVLLWRGHNLPGGGFIGGLVAATAFALYALAFGVAAARRVLRVEPSSLIAGGLLVALASGAVALVAGRPFMTGVWREIVLPLLGSLPVGTPLLFDTGVFLVVWGVTLLIAFSLMEE